ncbi:MAG: hypothetical protein EBU07_01580 [Betaproteobacteria bacterium]|nr:hypothetical protein [Betaproteobacteria bacterium]
MSEPTSVSGSVPRGVQTQQLEALAQGRLLIQRCNDCGRAIYYPREVCPHCGSVHLSLVEPSGLGTVHAVTTVRRKADAGGDLNVSLVDLDEGVRLMSRVDGVSPDAVRIGQRVRARIEQTEATAKEPARGKVVFDALTDTASAPTYPATAAPAIAPVAPAVHVDRSGLQALRGKTAIAGVATYGCGETPGVTDMDLLVRAAHAAVADAGLTMRDIDGICSASVAATMWVMPVIEHLGIRPSFIDGTMLGGSSFIAHLLPAMHALASGQCNAVLVCYGSAQRSGAFSRAEIARARRVLDPTPCETPYEPAMPVSAYALATSRHMHQYGTTRRQLAEVAVAARQWAQRNPEAFMRDPLSIDEVLSSRMVSDPLTVRDCCLVTDGGGAYVLVRADRARDLRRKPVHVLGNATAVWNRQISSMHDLTVTCAQQSGREAGHRKRLAPRDIGVLELYDAFTINTLLFLEDLGFCAKGEGGAFVEGGAIAPGGRLPVNTNGGGLSCTHPGMYGIFALIEAVRQLRGECGERQVPGVKTALAHGNGGTLSSQSTAILGTADML